MKRIVSMLIATTITIGLMAQGSAVTNAVLYHSNNDLIKAKQSIDEATKHEKTMGNSKTWYYNGLIYMDLAKKEPDLETKLSYFSTANASFQKAVDLNEKENYVNQSRDKKEELYGVIFNQGIEFHNTNDLDNALKFDQLAGEVAVKNPKSRANAYVNASIAAKTLGKIDEAILLNKKVLEFTPTDTMTYFEIINLYDGKNDIDNALKFAEKGAEKFPSDKRFTNEVARLAVKSGKGDEALKKLKDASAKDPKNTLYLNKIAELSDKMGNKAEAETYYLKSVEIDPENVDANYNLGAFYFNTAVEYNNKITNLDLNASPKERKELTDKMKENFNKCIPYYQKAYPQLNADEQENLKPSLMKALIKVGRDEEADKL